MYTVGIVGIGNIAAFYGTPETKAPYCHVGGIRLSDRVRLAAVSDFLDEKRDRFRDSWGAAFPGIDYYDSSTSMLAADSFDIAAHLDGGPQPHCTNETFSIINELCFAGLESFHSGQRVTLPNQNRTRRIFANG